MADHYLSFSEVLPLLTDAEMAWLREQLRTVCVFGGLEYPADDLPKGFDEHDADWIGWRAFRDMGAYDPDGGEGAGFEYHFREGGGSDWGRHLWLFAEEAGYLDRVAHLVQKFLQVHRPDQSWSLTYATTCSKPRVGEFGGGALFVTADEVSWENAYDFVEQRQKEFAEKQPRQQALRQAQDAADDGAPISEGGSVSGSEAGADFHVVRRWVLYDLDAECLITTRVYDAHESAVDDAQSLRDILVLPLIFRGISA